MLHRIVIFVMCILLASTLFGQKLSKEEEAVKAAIMQGGTAYLNRDYAKWSEIVVQDDRYLGFSVGPDELEFWSNFKEIDSFTKNYFEKYPDKMGAANFTDFKIIVSGNMAFVRCMDSSTPQARVLIKENGKWREIFYCDVAIGAYKLQELLKAIDKLSGEWTLNVNSYKAEPAWSYQFKGGSATIKRDGMTFEHKALYLVNDFEMHANTFFAWDDAQGQLKALNAQGVSSTWTQNGIAEMVDSGLKTSYFQKEDAGKLAWVHELFLKSPDVLAERYVYYTKEGLQERTQSLEWERK
jgi:hypothetical protein